MIFLIWRKNICIINRILTVKTALFSDYSRPSACARYKFGCILILTVLLHSEPESWLKIVHKLFFLFLLSVLSFVNHLHACICMYVCGFYSSSCIFVFLSSRQPSYPLWWLNCQACQVPSVQSWCHVTPPAACLKLIVLIGKRHSCNKVLRGDPPTEMKGLRFVLCQGLAGNRSVRWPAGQEGRTAALWLVWV